MKKSVFQKAVSLFLCAVLIAGVLHGSGGAGIGIENCLHVAVLHRHQSGNAEEHQLEGIPPVFPHTGDGLGALDGGHHQKNQTRNQQPHRGKPAGIDGSMAEQELPHRAGKAPADAGNEGVDCTPQGLIHGKSFFLEKIIESPLQWVCAFNRHIANPGSRFLPSL